ncbi:MAG: hypothetical protein ABMB14_31505 [Myxococcota bacterium]
MIDEVADDDDAALGLATGFRASPVRTEESGVVHYHFPVEIEIRRVGAPAPDVGELAEQLLEYLARHLDDRR